MHLPSRLHHVCAALALACALPASATVIDFEGTGAPIFFSDAAPLSTRYAAQGVSFAGVGGIGGAVVHQEVELGIAARSGTDFLGFNLDAGIGPDERISFAAGQDTVSIFAATYEALVEPVSFSMSAFDALGNLLGSTTIAGARDWRELTLSASGIHSVVVSSTAYTWGLDDLSFTGASADVPEPATFGLIGAALAGAMLSRRRRPIR